MHIVRYLVEQKKADVNSSSKDGWHSLMFAVIGGHVDVIDFLIYETKVDLDRQDKFNMNAKELAGR